MRDQNSIKIQQLFRETRDLNQKLLHAKQVQREDSRSPSLGKNSSISPARRKQSPEQSKSPEYRRMRDQELEIISGAKADQRAVKSAWGRSSSKKGLEYEQMHDGVD